MTAQLEAVLSALDRLNALSHEGAVAELLRVCGSARWADEVARRRFFVDPRALRAASEAAWDALDSEDWGEAFACHTRLGEQGRPAGRAGAWPSSEQAGMRSAADRTLAGLARAQRLYEERFGRVFLICATGKSGEEMLGQCEARLANDPETELIVAAGEERKIGRLRLEKLLLEGGV
ncbi:hypothetical protein BH18GEM1_BH18GEM1_16130 [soil metagenome]